MIKAMTPRVTLSPDLSPPPHAMASTAKYAMRHYLTAPNHNLDRWTVSLPLWHALFKARIGVYADGRRYVFDLPVRVVDIPGFFFIPGERGTEDD